MLMITGTWHQLAVGIRGDWKNLSVDTTTSRTVGSSVQHRYAVQSAQKINRVTRRTKLVTHLARFVRYACKVRYFAREVRYLTRRETLL